MNASECARMITYIENNLDTTKLDTVDQKPEYQALMNLSQMILFFGIQDSKAISLVPNLLTPGPPVEDLQCFGRKFSSDNRSSLDAHHDTSDYTINIALNDHTEYEGGQTFFTDPRTGNRTELDRSLGDAFISDKTVPHGVKPVMSGVRYTFVCFYYEAKQKELPKISDLISEAHKGLYGDVEPPGGPSAPQGGYAPINPPL